MCFRLQIHSRWMMKTHWRPQSQRSHSGGPPRTKQEDSGQESLRTNIQKHTEALHSSTTWVWRNAAQHSTGQSPVTIPSFSACIHTSKQLFSRQDWQAVSPVLRKHTCPKLILSLSQLLLHSILLSSFVMVALCNRAGHYIFPWGFYLSSFFPRLISAATDWMSTILIHIAWP